MSAQEQDIYLKSAPTVSEGNEEALKDSQPQQGRCECTKGCTECEMELRMRQFRSEILKSLSPPEIMPRMCSCGLFDSQAESKFFSDGTIPRTKKAERILALIEGKEHSQRAYSQFLECLKDESDDLHLGNRYIASLLQGTSFADEHDINASARFKKRITGKNMPDVVSLTDAYELVPLLRREKLLTLDEMNKCLQKTRTNKDILLDLLKILNTKGPTAHYIFVYCLRKETSHPGHKELFDTLSRGVQTEGGLITKTYFEAMKKIRRLHLSGKWEEADAVVEEAIAKNGVDVQVAVLLESCTGLIIRQEMDKVLEIVSKAREMCSQITTNCQQLKGRCEWVLANLFRYMNEKDKAREHIKKAMEIQFNIEPGEDTALTNYCYASILLESLAENVSSEDEKDSRESLELARHYFELAMDHARIGDYGLELSHPLHKEVFIMLSSGGASADSTYERLKRKRKAEAVEADATSLGIKRMIK